MIHYEVNYHPRNWNRRQTDITESSLVKSIDSLWFVLIRKYLKFFFNELISFLYLVFSALWWNKARWARRVLGLVPTYIDWSHGKW